MKKMVLFAAVASMMLVGCKKQDAAIVTEEEQAAEPVEVTVLQSREIQREISLSSNLQGYETVNIAPSLTGKIEHIYTEVGTRVRKGDSLVRMDQQQYNTTKLVYSNLLVEMKRVEGLIQTGSVSQQTYDQTKLQLDQTKENLDFLTKNTFVRAPFSGVISAKNYEDGELYSGQPILVLTQIDRLKALIAIPESYIPQVKTGMKLTLRSDVYPDKEFPATIEIVYPTVDATSHTFQAKVVMQNNGGLLRPGMYVTAELDARQVNGVAVPTEAVVYRNGSNAVWIVDEEGKASRKLVKLGIQTKDFIQIAEGLEGNESVIVEGMSRMNDGDKVLVVE